MAPERMQYKGKGKDRLLYLIREKHPFNRERKCPLAFAYLQNNNLKSWRADLTSIFLNNQLDKFRYMSQFKEKYLITPIEVGIWFQAHPQKCIALGHKNKKARVTGIEEAMDIILSSDTREIYFYEIMPYVDGLTLNAIKKSGQFDIPMQTSLVKLLRKFWCKYAHHDLTGGNIMYGTTCGNSKNVKPCWYIIDNGQLSLLSSKKKRPLVGRRRRLTTRKTNAAQRNKKITYTLASLDCGKGHPDAQFVQELRVIPPKNKSKENKSADIKKSKNPEVIDLFSSP
jgi:hypothetical protein